VNRKETGYTFETDLYEGAPNGGVLVLRIESPTATEPLPGETICKKGPDYEKCQKDKKIVMEKERI